MGEHFLCIQEVPRVEIFYTENLILNAEQVERENDTATVGRGLSTPGGLPETRGCTTCNLYAAGYSDQTWQIQDFDRDAPEICLAQTNLMCSAFQNVPSVS